ncbi:hypothetical protein [Saccharicrinis sp. FJH54]|uniref:hypothetical protein n=1 Tax=Saccharicrinis sp. FJH54 TaxID=3344665 RepID=UPI0035D4E8EB
MTDQPTNPFTTTTYIGPKYFCDRKHESDLILKKVKNGSSITLLSVRRMGKTGLIHHINNQLPNDVIGVYVDILNTENLTGFLNQLSSALINASEKNLTTGNKIWKFIRSLRPTIGFDSLTGSPYTSFNIQKQETENNIENIFQFIDTSDQKYVIAIDEFQQILNYPEENTDAWLRTIIQKLKKRHLSLQVVSNI